MPLKVSTRMIFRLKSEIENISNDKSTKERERRKLSLENALNQMKYYGQLNNRAYGLLRGYMEKKIPEVKTEPVLNYC